MPNIGAFAQKQILDWILGGVAAPSTCSFRYAGLAWGTPTLTGGSELNTSFGYSRLTVLFGAANSPAGSASNTAPMTFGPFSSIASILGIQMWDGSPVASSNMWLYGTLQTARTVGVGDSLVVAAGALTVTLS
jgi:hypothetical protein